MALRYRVHLVESERGWGQERWHEDYNTRKDAENRILEVNSKNTAKYAPNIYTAADPKIEIIELDN